MITKICDQAAITTLEDQETKVKGGSHEGIGLLGEAPKADHVLPGEKKGEVPDNFYLEIIPRPCYRLLPTIPEE